MDHNIFEEIVHNLKKIPKQLDHFTLDLGFNKIDDKGSMKLSRNFKVLPKHLKSLTFILEYFFIFFKQNNFCEYKLMYLSSNNHIKINGAAFLALKFQYLSKTLNEFNLVLRYIYQK